MGKYATIVIPTYKRPDRIERAVLSALSQTYNNTEIIVVDDNGKDTEYAKETKAVLKKYIETGKIIYIQNEVNSGGSFSRNQGLAISKGEYITFLDDDDEIDESKIAKQIECLEALGDEYSAVYTGYHKVTQDNKTYSSTEHIQGDVYQYALSRSIYVGSGSNLLVRTKNAKEIDGYDISFKRNQDLEFMVRILERNKLAFVDEDLLTIHYEIREVKRNYEDFVAIDSFYLSKFRGKIDLLNKNEARKIYKIIALERFRYSLSNRKIVDAFQNMIRNKVNAIDFFRYIFYLIDRILFKKSYGFKL